MKKLLFALYDVQGYMKLLTDYFVKKTFLFETHLFTRQESLMEFLKGHSLDVLLLGQEIEICRLQYLHHAHHVIIMSEGDMVSECQEYPTIFKYQSAEKILREIFRITAQDETELPVSVCGYRGHTEFIGIYRPYGEMLPVERFFLTEDGEEKKILFINMELLSGFHRQENAAEEEIRGMSEVIFYLKQQQDKLSLKLRSLIRQEQGADYLYPVEDYRDLYSMNREDMDSLLSVLANETEYGRIVFDVGFLSDSSLYLLYCCDKVYIPQARSDWEENQKDALEHLLMREGLGEMLDSIHYISPQGGDSD